MRAWAEKMARRSEERKQEKERAVAVQQARTVTVEAEGKGDRGESQRARNVARRRVHDRSAAGTGGGASSAGTPEKGDRQWLMSEMERMWDLAEQVELSAT
jgi:hypothetical protein